MAHIIDKINVHEDDPGLLYWFVHGKRMGPVRRDYAAKLGIEVGALWSKTLARKVEHVAQLNACHAAALAFLAKRDFIGALVPQVARGDSASDCGSNARRGLGE